ncbi:MAG TPA: ABC transporter permease, partial [Microterricola sp.]
MSTSPAVVMPSSEPIVLDSTVIKSWKAPIAFGIFTVIAFVMFVLNARPGETTFRLSSERDTFQLPDVVVNSATAGWVVFLALLVITAASALAVISRRKTSIWLTVLFALLFMVGFLSWAAAGSSIPVTGLLFGSVSLAVPLIFGAL